MTTPNASTSGDNPGASGSGNSKGEADKDKTYPAEFVEKLKTEVKNYRTKVEELEQKFNTLESDKLKKDGDFKTLYEQQLKLNTDLKSELAKTTETTASQKKKEALTKQLFKIGLDERYLEDALKLTSVKNLVLDPETQTVFGAEEEAKNFLEKYKGLGFLKTVKGSRPNHDAPRTIQNPEIPDLSKMTQNEKIAYLGKVHKKA